MRIKTLIVGVALGAIAVGGIYMMRAARPVSEDVSGDTKEVKKATKVKEGVVAQRARKGRPPIPQATDPVSRAIVAMLGVGNEADEERKLTDEIYAVLAKMTEDQRKAVKMRIFLDKGQKHEAIRLARDLMDSTDPEVRYHVANVLGWIGPAGLPELTAMLADSDLQVAQTAFDQWQNAFNLIEIDAEKAEVLGDLLPNLDSRAQMDLALMSVTRMRQEMALETLSEIIEGNRGTEVEKAAVAMWNHMTCDISTGEKVEYANPDSVQEYLQIKRDEQQNAAELWKQIAEAIAKGDDNTARALLGLDVIADSTSSPGNQEE